MNEHSINMSWSLETLVAIEASHAARTFTLTISSGSSTQILSLNESYFHFSPPEGASPCEIYNFSVTATYVGATYTGAGCSTPSPILSWMLPSLPDISEVEASFQFSLVKQSGKLNVNVSFMVSFSQ